MSSLAESVDPVASAAYGQVLKLDSTLNDYHSGYTDLGCHRDRSQFFAATNVLDDSTNDPILQGCGGAPKVENEHALQRLKERTKKCAVTVASLSCTAVLTTPALEPLTPSQSVATPAVDDLTAAALSAECSHVTLLVQAQPDGALAPLMRDARWLWPATDEVHGGERGSIPCTDTADRCRLCVQHALSRSLPSFLREKYVRHDHAYIDSPLAAEHTASIVERVVECVIEKKYSDSLNTFWRNSTVKYSLCPSQLCPTELSGSPMTIGDDATVTTSDVQVEGMEATHLSAKAGFNEVEVSTTAAIVEESSPPTSVESAEPSEFFFPEDLCEMDYDFVNQYSRSGLVEDQTGPFSIEEVRDNEEVVYVVKTTTDKTGVAPQTDIVIEKHVILKQSPSYADCGASSTADAVLNRNCLRYEVAQRRGVLDKQIRDEDDDDILETCMDVLNTLVQKTHDQIDGIRRGSARSAAARHHTTTSLGLLVAPSKEADETLNAPAHVRGVMERRLTRGLKIDFAKLDSFEDELDCRRVKGDRSASTFKGVITYERKRKQKYLQDNMPVKWLCRENSMDRRCDPGSDTENQDNCDSIGEAEQFFNQYSDFRPDMLDEVLDRRTCVCVTCDPRMVRLRRQDNYLSDSDFFKTARFVSRLGELPDKGLIDASSCQKDTSTSSSGCSDEDIADTRSPTPEPLPCDDVSADSCVVYNIQTDPNDNLQVHECSLCHEKFCSTDDLHRHLSSHEYRGEGLVSSKCSICEIIFRDLRVIDGALCRMPTREPHSERRDQHERRHRPNAINCVYPQCRNYVFGSRQSLIAHMDQHRQAVMEGGVERWDLPDRSDKTSGTGDTRPHISCEFCLIDFNWRTRMNSMKSHTERYRAHRARHMRYEMMGDPWHCALDGCQNSFSEQAELEEHMWVTHAMRCYCAGCDWIVWGDFDDVQLHRNNCNESTLHFAENGVEEIFPESGSLDMRAPAVETNGALAQARCSPVGIGSGLVVTILPPPDSSERTSYADDERGFTAGNPPTSINVVHIVNTAEPVQPVRKRGRPKLLHNLAKATIERDSNSAASALHLMNFSFYCNFCGAPFRRHHAKQHQLHVESHMPNRTLTCVFDDCGQEFASREQLHAHVKTKLSTCRYCGCVLFEGYKKHISTCRILHELEKHRLRQERAAQADRRPGSERRELRWANDGQLESCSGGSLSPSDNQEAFLRNIGLAKGSAQAVQQKKRIREESQNSARVASAKGRRACTLSVSCSKCGQVFRTSLNLKQHVMEYHSNDSAR